MANYNKIFPIPWQQKHLTIYYVISMLFLYGECIYDISLIFKTRTNIFIFETGINSSLLKGTIEISSMYHKHWNTGTLAPFLQVKTARFRILLLNQEVIHLQYLLCEKEKDPSHCRELAMLEILSQPVSERTTESWRVRLGRMRHAKKHRLIGHTNQSWVPWQTPESSSMSNPGLAFRSLPLGVSYGGSKDPA